MNLSDLSGLRLPDLRLRSTAGGTCDLSALPSHTILIFSPFILPPVESIPEITLIDRPITGGLEQLLYFVRLHPEFASRGIALYGISTQSPPRTTHYGGNAGIAVSIAQRLESGIV